MQDVLTGCYVLSWEAGHAVEVPLRLQLPGLCVELP